LSASPSPPPALPVATADSAPRRRPRAAAPDHAAAITSLLYALRHEDGLRDGFRHHEIVSARPPATAPLPSGWEALAPALTRSGITALYRHQARALARLEAGADVVLATPTASGKTLVYGLPVLRSLVEGAPGHALFLFPLKALGRDQRDRLLVDVAALGRDAAGVVEIYDGDTPTGRRKAIRERPPRVLITTPDMLHAGILPNHASWQALLGRLELVVLDELHSYRGVFGAHVAQVLRRLLRAAAHHGARPQLVAASATIANPGELAHALTGRPFEVIEDDGAPRPRRHVVLVNPSGSPYTAAARIFRLGIERGLRTIAFTKARRVTELIHTWVVEAEPRLRERISSYRAGFLPEERREIEQRLFSGALDGVISTSALELGIDVGGLDLCVLVGYPGSQMATWQRAGRVGRAQEGVVVLVAQPDALDQYLVAHPRALFDGAFEHAVVDPHNPEVAAAHLPCAADELPLRDDEAWLADAAVRANVALAEERGRLLRSEAGTEWFAARRRPHRDVDLRQAGASYAIQLDLAGERAPEIGTIGAARVLAECHEGAIYLHRGRQYLVTELDLAEKRVRVRAVDAAWFTRALSEKETEILSRDAARPAGHFRVVRGRLRVTTRITGFERRRVHGQELLGTEPLELPPTSIETTGIWLEIPDEVPAALRAAGLHPMGGLHAVEHAALALFPLFALCDRHDVGGITTLGHAQVGRAAVFLYDGAPGGMGLATGLFDRVETLLEATLTRVRDCPCEAGCPACVHSPKCGSGNRPIDKAARRARSPCCSRTSRSRRPGAPSRPRRSRRSPHRPPSPRARHGWSISTSRPSAAPRTWAAGTTPTSCAWPSPSPATTRARASRPGASATSRRCSTGCARRISWSASTCAASTTRSCAATPTRISARSRPSTSSRRSATGSASGSRSATSPRRTSARRRAPTGSRRWPGGGRGGSTRSSATAAATSSSCARSSPPRSSAGTSSSAPAAGSACASRRRGPSRSSSSARGRTLSAARRRARACGRSRISK
jgi:DEAD/DEAH box helicase domain-containing protein